VVNSANRQTPAFRTAPRLSLLVAAVGLAVAGCAGGGSGTARAAAGATGTPAAPAASSRTGGGAGDRACTGGLTGREPGVVRMECGGTATIHVQVGSIIKDFTGGQCRSAGDIWSVSAGVITDASSYSGPPVDVVTVNNTASGTGTIQTTIDKKNYFDLGAASLSLSADRRTAHLQGKSEALSDAPGAAITVDVTC
jgi:hypothetical protein